MNHTFDNFSQLSRPIKEAQFVNSNLEDIVQQLVKLFWGILKDREIAMHIDNQIKEKHINTSPKVLSQVLVNIIENSINSFKEHNRKAEIRISITPKNEIIVLDNGVGIDASILNRIIEPGFTTFPNKAGFGLFIAKSLVEDVLKGKLIIESKVNIGTKVIIQLNN